MGFPGGKHAKISVTGYATLVYSDAYAINLYSSLSIMGDQPDEKTKEFNKEELSACMER